MDLTSIPTRVRGNEIPCSVPLQIVNLADDPPTPTDFTPLSTDEIAVRLIGPKVYEFEPTVSSNVLSFVMPATAVVGVYSCEIIISRAQGSNPDVLRSYRRDVLRIVESNEEANLAVGVELEAGGEELQNALLTVAMTAYTAGTGITISDGEISVDSTVVAMQSDIPDPSTLATKTELANASPILADTRTSEAAAITATAPFATLVDGQRVTIRLTYRTKGNTTLNLTLSGGTTTGAKAVYVSTSASFLQVQLNTFKAGALMEVVWNATQDRWDCVTQADTNTTYDLSSKADILTEQSVAAASDITLACVSDKYYVIGAVTNLTLTFTAPTQGIGVYGGKFTAASASTALTLPLGVTADTGSPTSFEANEVYEFNMVDNVIIIRKL